MRQLVVLAGIAFTSFGCSGKITPKINPGPVDVSGSVARAGQPVKDVVHNLQPTGPGALPAAIPLKDGSFQAHVSPGRYTYFISQGTSKEAFAAIPEGFQSGSMDRQIDVAPGKPIEIKLD